jgi:hypothetical protein
MRTRSPGSQRRAAALLDTLAGQLFREVDAWHPVAPAARA